MIKPASTIVDFPNNALVKLIRFLRFPDILNFSLTNKRLFSNEKLWSDLLKINFFGLESYLCETDEQNTYKNKLSMLLALEDKVYRCATPEQIEEDALSIKTNDSELELHIEDLPETLVREILHNNFAKKMHEEARKHFEGGKYKQAIILFIGALRIAADNNLVEDNFIGVLECLYQNGRHEMVINALNEWMKLREFKTKDIVRQKINICNFIVKYSPEIENDKQTVKQAKNLNTLAIKKLSEKIHHFYEIQAKEQDVVDFFKKIPSKKRNQCCQILCYLTLSLLALNKPKSAKKSMAKAKKTLGENITDGVLFFYCQAVLFAENEECFPMIENVMEAIYLSPTNLLNRISYNSFTNEDEAGYIIPSLDYKIIRFILEKEKLIHEYGEKRQLLHLNCTPQLMVRNMSFDIQKGNPGKLTDKEKAVVKSFCNLEKPMVVKITLLRCSIILNLANSDLKISL